MKLRRASWPLSFRSSTSSCWGVNLTFSECTIIEIVQIEVLHIELLKPGIEILWKISIYPLGQPTAGWTPMWCERRTFGASQLHTAIFRKDFWVGCSQPTQPKIAILGKTWRHLTIFRIVEHIFHVTFHKMVILNYICLWCLNLLKTITNDRYSLVV